MMKNKGDEMKKSSLKSGVHSVVFRNENYINISDNWISDWLYNYNEDLTHKSDKDFDIIEVKELNPIWQREEKEMIEIDGVEYEKEEIKRALELKNHIDSFGSLDFNNEA